MADYKAVKVIKGKSGWGGPLIIKPTDEKKYIGSVTGGGIHPVCQRIAELSGGEAVDAFKKGVPMNQLACVVIDCGGTARIGVYPSKNIPTVDIHPSSPSGPLSRFIKPEIFVSGVTVNEISLVEE